MSTATAPVIKPSAQNGSYNGPNGVSTTYQKGASQISAATSMSSQLSAHSETSTVQSASSYTVQKYEEISSGGFAIATAEAEFARLMSEIPWMRFQITATPDAAWLKEERFRAVFQKLTQKTARATSAKVFEQIHKETKTMLERLAAIEEDIDMTSVMEEIHREFAGETRGALTGPETLVVGYPPCHEHGCGKEDIVPTPEPPRTPSPTSTVKPWPQMPDLSKAHWIWTNEAAGHPLKKAPTGARNFRRKTHMHDGQKVDRVVIDITSSHYDTLYVNGKLVGSTDAAGPLAWQQPRRYTVRLEPPSDYVIVSVWATHVDKDAQGVQGDGKPGLLVSGVAWNSQKTELGVHHFHSSNSWIVGAGKEEFKKSLREGSKYHRHTGAWHDAYDLGLCKTSTWKGPLKSSPIVKSRGNGSPARIAGCEDAPDSDVPRAGFFQL